MGKKSKRNRANSKKKSTRQMEGGAATTRSSGVDAGEIVAESRPRANTASSTTNTSNAQPRLDRITRSQGNKIWEQSVIMTSPCQKCSVV